MNIHIHTTYIKSWVHFDYKLPIVPITQLVECSTFNRMVAGSTPARDIFDSDPNGSGLFVVKHGFIPSRFDSCRYTKLHT